VRIASPPVPISPETPASYASSPEETRYVRFHGSPLPQESGAVPDAQAVAPNPFQTSSSDGERDEVDQVLLENTRRNSALGSRPEPGRGNGAPDAVKATLARFAGVPRRSAVQPASGRREENGLVMSQSSRPALDVDAFKRLLLTGESGTPADQAMPASTHTTSPPATNNDSSSSNADTASVSQYSIFEPSAPVITDTPRTSHELDREAAATEREVVVAETTMEKKPPIPRPRHGKSLASSLTNLQSPLTNEVARNNQITPASALEDLRLSSPSDLNKPLPPPPVDNSFPTTADPTVSPIFEAPAATRRPPTPPLTRRRSQHRSQSLKASKSALQGTSSDTHLGGDFSLDQNFTPTAAKVPPPPPMRRQKRFSDIGIQRSEATVHEEEASLITSSQPQLSPSSSMTSLSQSKPQPPPSRTPSGAKRLPRISGGSPSMGPPPPPPRRVRGSSRSSFDSQIAVLPHDPRSSSELRRTSTDSSRNASSQSTSQDILADLAALQLDVDRLRSKQGEGTSNTK
jgi:hypothetical protein